MADSPQDLAEVHAYCLVRDRTLRKEIWEAQDLVRKLENKRRRNLDELTAIQIKMERAET